MVCVSNLDQASRSRRLDHNRRRRCRHEGIGELQELYIGQMIAPVTARNRVAYDGRVADMGDLVVAGIARIYRRIYSGPAVDGVVANSADDDVVAGAAINR